MNEGTSPADLTPYDVVYAPPPRYWQDGLVLGNGSMGAVFSAPHALEWIVNKTDVIDPRTPGVRRVVPPEEALALVRQGWTTRDFDREERGEPAPEGAGPKSCCRLLVDLGGAALVGQLPSIHSRLSLQDATLRLALDKHLSHPRVISFVCAEANLLVISARQVSPLVGYVTRIDFSRPEDAELEAPELAVERDRLVLRMQMPGGLRYSAVLQVGPRHSSAYREDLLLRLREKYRAPEVGEASVRVLGAHGLGTVGGDFDLCLTVVTSTEADDPTEEAHRRLDAAARSTADELHDEHRRHWEEFWGRSSVELGDLTLEQHFYRSLYALRTAYRVAPMSGLLGLCYGPSPGPVQITPWAGDLHHDQNVQCPFLPVHTLNHSDLFDAYLDTYEAFLPEARRLAREIWGAEGAHFDMAFNAAGRSVLGGVGNYRFFYGGAYVALMHCLCWRTRRDVQQLRERIYPFLREVLDFYLCIAQRGEDGLYHFWPAHTPELDIADTSDPVQLLCMLRVCLRTALEAAEVLGDSGERAERWRDLLEHLPGYTLVEGEGGVRVLDAVGVPPDHHISQACGLYPVYPCGEVDALSSPEEIALYRRTLEAVEQQAALKSCAIEEGHYFVNAWQCFFLAISALRLGLVGEFWERYLPLYLRCHAKPNGLFSHDATVVVEPELSEANVERIPDATLQDVDERMPVFEPWCGHSGTSTPNPEAKAFSTPLIEASADYLTMVTEALLQSHNGIVRVFPGWPREKDAAFRGFVAEGNVGVSASLRDGVVEAVRLERRAGGVSEVTLLSPWSGRVLSVTLPEEGECVLTGDPA